jgi:hypothetical protein
MCNCTTFKTYDLLFTEPTPKPLTYKVKWRVVGGNWNELPPQGPPPIRIFNIPTCCAVEGEVTPNCGTTEAGVPILGVTSPFGIAASATYTASLTANGACVPGSGAGQFILTGTPGQVVVLRLILSQSILFNNTGSGSCAWMAGSISSRGSTVTGFSQGTTDTVIASTLTLPSSITLSVTIPPAGTTTVDTNVNIYNSTLVTAPTASLQIVSVDGVTAANLPSPVCTALGTTTGCVPSSFAP